MSANVSAPIDVRGVHHVSVLVTDTERALRFYMGVLGLSLNAARPDLGYPGAWLRVGEQEIHLMELPSPDAGQDRPAHGGRDRHAALLVGALAPLQQALELAGIGYTVSRSGRRALFCRDPDGNAWELIETRPRPDAP